jgi:predicted ATPase
MTTGYALSFGAILNGLFVADPERDHRLSEEALNYCIQHDLRAYLPWARFYRGLAMARNGQPKRGIGLMREGMAAAEQIRMKMARAIHLGHLGSVQALLGDLDAALDTLGQSLRAISDTGERAFEAELYRMKASLLLKSDKAEEAEEALGQAVAIARRQQARMWELRAATMLARIRAHQGQVDAARELLRPAYVWFKEGFGTPDLREAKVLLDALR